VDANELPAGPISLIAPEAIRERQREVARLVAGGITNGQIAQELGVTLDGAVAFTITLEAIAASTYGRKPFASLLPSAREGV
jgi:hypothetical protein